MKPLPFALALTVLLFSAADPGIQAAPPPTTPASAAHERTRVLPPGVVPGDRRLGEPRHLNNYFPFRPPASLAAWEVRAATLRRRILVATGLWPMPRETPLNAVIHGRVERDGFTVEKVYFESYPGHFVTGLLFRPENATAGAELPAVLCPHGHGGRLQDHGPEKILREIVAGAERFEGSGRYPKLARCAQLARMGCVTFIYDMIGYADSTQIPRDVAHRGREDEPGVDTKENWRFFTTQAELRLQSIFGLQTYNSIRSLDFLTNLPDVDPTRIGVTGGSGGGTQTIILTAIDPRPVVAFPQGMVSTSMQGGCTCENVSLLRIDSGNVELAALFAPKPQAMTAADDWTRDMMTKGYPELQHLYSLFGAKENVLCKSLVHFPHNYNYVTRAIMYAWFNEHLKLGLEAPVVEGDFSPLTEEEWIVWNEEHPQPRGGVEHERELLHWIDDDSNRQFLALTPTDAGTLKTYHSVVGGAFETIIGRAAPAPEDIERREMEKADRGDYREFKDVVRLHSAGEELPLLSLYPGKKDWNKEVVIWVDGGGKASLFDAKHSMHPAVSRLLDAGAAVVAADLLHQGEFLRDGRDGDGHVRSMKFGKRSAAYAFGYNDALFAQRVHDILTLVSFVHSDARAPRAVHLLGLNGAGPWVAAARALLGERIHRTALDTRGFRFVDVKSYEDEQFLPGAVKYGDIPGLLALCAPHDLWIAGENGLVPALVGAAYQAAGKSDAVVSSTEEDAAMAAVAWLLEDD